MPISREEQCMKDNSKAFLLIAANDKLNKHKIFYSDKEE